MAVARDVPPMKRLKILMLLAPVIKDVTEVRERITMAGNDARGDDLESMHRTLVLAAEAVEQAAACLR